MKPCTLEKYKYTIWRRARGASRPNDFFRKRLESRPHVCLNVADTVKFCGAVGTKDYFQGLCDVSPSFTFLDQESLLPPCLGHCSLSAHARIVFTRKGSCDKEARGK